MSLTAIIGLMTNDMIFMIVYESQKIFQMVQFFHIDSPQFIDVSLVEQLYGSCYFIHQPFLFITISMELRRFQ